MSSNNNATGSADTPVATPGSAPTTSSSLASSSSDSSSSSSTDTSNTTASSAPPTTTTTSTPPTTTTTTTTTSSTPPTTTTTTTTTPSTTSTPPPTTTTTTTTTSTTTTSTTSTTTSTTRPPTTSSVVTPTSVSFVTPPESRTTVLETSTSVDNNSTPTSSPSRTSSSSSSGTAGLIPGQSQTSGSSGLSGGGKIAVAVVVPIVAVALIVLGLLFLWRKRKQRKDAEELRRKEVEEYGYNPNNDPTLPGIVSGDGPYEMREEGASGYRGWGTTAVASSGRKASTTLSGGQSAGGIGMAYSDAASPTHGALSDTLSDHPLVDGHSEAEPLGNFGPAASGNRSGDINRGPSNASSSYSAANRSDASGEGPVPGGAYGAAQYYSNDQYGGGNPYSDPQYGSPPRAEMSGQPVIRDVQARRNTRIENPSHFPQQSAGISQNF